MKFFTFSILLFLTTILSAQTMQEIDRYLTYFNNQHIEVNNLAMTYLQYSVHSEDFGTIEQQRKKLIKQLNSSVEFMEKIEPIEGGEDLKTTALEVFRSYLESFNLDFVQLMELKVESKTSYDAMEKYFAARKEAEKKVDEAAQRYAAAQRTFAEKHNIEIKEAEQNAGMQELNLLNNYHQSVFLKYSKILMRNNEFMQYLNAQQMENISKSRLQLVKDTKETLKVLEAMPAFKEDTEYRDAVAAFVREIQKLAVGDYKDLETILKKAETERTQEDVDTFNSAMQNFQTVIPQINAAVNEKGNELLKKYVPKPRVAKQL
ncbi:MAG: hypothetical protein AAF599_13905 [Bacteroidota bacterium]